MNKLLKCMTLSLLAITSQTMKLSTSTILQFPNTAEKISLLISIDTDQSSIDDQVTIVVTGPINRNYFAIGFGNNQMLETYSIIFYPNGDINEYLLTSKTSQQQQLLNTSINIDYFANSQNIIKAMITRDIEGITDDHYSFNNVITNSLNKLDIIYAMSSSQNISSSNTLNYHGIYKNRTTIYFEKESNGTNPSSSSYDFIDNFLDDADNINNFENYINHTQFVTIGDILPPSINNADSDTNFFDFLSATQWIVLSGCVACFIIMSLILLLFYRFYRRWKIRSLYDTADEDEDDEISQNGGLKQKSSIIHHCYHEKKKSILTQLDDEMLDEIHGAVMPQCIDIDEDDDNYCYNDINQRPYHNRGKVADFMRNVMPFEIPKDLIALNDDDESYEDGLDDEEEEFEEDEEEVGHDVDGDDDDEDDEIEEEDEEGDAIISDLSDSGSIRM